MYRFAWILLFAALATNAADSTTTARDAHRARIDAAISARDYQAWKAEHDSWGGKGRMAAKVTPENFDTYARMHEAMRAGRTDEADKLRQELGVKGGRHGGEGLGRGGKGRGQGQGMGNGSGEGHGAGCRGNR